MGFIYNYIGAENKATYDLENRIADPEQRIEQFMESVLPLDGAALVDIGAGGGFHACRFAHKAAAVFAVEPAPAMLRHLYAGVAESGLSNVSILAAEAGDLPLQENLADVVHARFAYFFGPERETVRSCEPGIAEAMRILKPGGCFFVIDNALTSGQFAALLSRYGYTRGKAVEMQRQNDQFYAAHGFQAATIESSWTAPDRVALRQVIAMEFSDQDIEAMMAEVSHSELSYHYRIYWRRK